MRIEHSKHIENRMMLRRIAPELPKIIVKEAEEKFFDVATGYLIAVEKVELYGKSREVMVAYIEREENVVKLLTIHPLKKGQKKNRIKTGRWKRIQ